MKAPNGKPTNLNEEQWATVRTKRFKDWFGDWELGAKFKNLTNATSISEAQKTAEKWIGKELTNENLGIKATLSKNAIGKLGSSKATEKSISYKLHAKAVANIGTLFEKSLFEISHSDSKQRPEVDNVKRLGSLMHDDNTNSYIPVMITLISYNDKNGNKIYSVEAVDLLEKKKSAGQMSDNSNMNPHDPITDFITKIQKEIETAKNVSKVVDENGEPMVVYHGARSTEQFNIFNEVENGIYFSSNKEVAEAFKNENAYVLTINGEDFVLDKDSANALKDEVEPYWDIESMMGYNLAEDFVDNINEALNNGALQIGFSGEISNEDIVELRENTNPFFETFLNIRNPKTIDFNNEHWGGKKGTIEENLDKSKDGFIAKNIIEGGLISELPSSTTYVTFHPNQIKSATDNAGTYSEDSNDIRYQIIGEQGAANLDKSEETTHRLDNLAVAREMETAGKTPNKTPHKNYVQTKETSYNPCWYEPVKSV